MPHDAEAFLDRLDRHATASAALAEWCATRFPGCAGPLAAAVIEDRELAPAEPAPLPRDPGAPMRYRRVRLDWGGTMVSQAENWYLPRRLPPGIAARLLDSTIPFGVLLAPFAPLRRAIRTEILDRSDVALEVQAVMALPGRGDVALVRELYSRALLPE
ncbi:hypothetical protein D2T31_13860 [Sinirhodobacter populi]|uniref:UTRA domain-containing protein n=1 Tax=Paenirhodobacter populi TaxID=2306993 RepID=A0A443K6N9_9RHOB|nr:hypothetical protein [Sinirhodobacter populi]RWR28438.1 hypothetical protein D2T31_13860 [Sinirhodobacter populi]